MRASLIKAPDTAVFGEEITIQWRVESMEPGDPYRTGIHYSRDSTAHLPREDIGLRDLPGSTAHHMGNSSGEFSVSFRPLERGDLYYRLHVERHNAFIWSAEYTVEVLQPKEPVVLVDADRMPSVAWTNQSTEVPVLSAPSDAEVTSTTAVASYPDSEVIVGRHEANESDSYAINVTFPRPAQAVPIHMEATLANGRTLFSPPQRIQVVHEDGAVGQMVGGQLAAPVGQPFQLYWQLNGNNIENIEHTDLHVSMASERMNHSNPKSLRLNVTPTWDETNSVYRAKLKSDETGFLVTRIHTKSNGIETWSRTYVIEIYPS